jgi:hypothetical protein
MARNTQRAGGRGPGAGAMPPARPVESEADKWEQKPADRVLTVNGKPIPPEFAHVIPFAHTDQGIAESQADGRPRAVTSVVRDEFSKKIDAYGAQPWDSGDPLTGVVDAVREPGFSYKALSPRVIEKRGMRGFEIVPGARFGNMPIGRMPIKVARERNEHYRREGQDALDQAVEQYAVDQEKLIRDGKVTGLAPLRPGDVLQDARNPERAASIGHTSSRGTGADAA